MGFGTQCFGGFPVWSLKIFGDSFLNSQIKVAAATPSSSEVCGEAVKIPAAQLLSNMSHCEHYLHQFHFKYRVHLKVFIQLFKANLNFVLTQEITSPSVTTVNEKHLTLSDSKDSPSVVSRKQFSWELDLDKEFVALKSPRINTYFTWRAIFLSRIYAWY